MTPTPPIPDDSLPDLESWSLLANTPAGLSIALAFTVSPSLLTVRLHEPGRTYPRHPELIVQGARADESTHLVQTAIREAARHVISQHGPLTRSEVATEPETST